MDKPIEVLLSEIRSDVAKLKSKLDDQGASKTPQESDEWKRLSARSEFTQGTLTVFTIVFTILTMLFSVIGVISAVNLSELHTTARETVKAFNEVQDKAQNAENRAEKLIQAAQSYPQMLGDVTQSDVLISEGDREYEARKYRRAQQFAELAIAQLSSVLERTGLSIKLLVDTQTFDEQACAIDGGTRDPCVLSSGSDPLSATDKLRPAICEALFAAEDSRLKAILAANNEEAASNKEAAKKKEAANAKEAANSARTLIALFGGRPEGYHWMGLVEEEKGQNQNAAKCFDKSLSQGGLDEDYLNLAELRFVSGNYEDSYSNAKQYTDLLSQSGSDPYSDPRGIIAMFYFSLADFMRGKGKDSSALADFRKQMTLLKGTAKGTAVLNVLQRSFSSTVLDHYLDELDSGQKKLDDDYKKTEVIITANCFLGRNDCPK
jgi:tetratricopeptide (TPR) repeat protein